MMECALSLSKTRSSSLREENWRRPRNFEELPQESKERIYDFLSLTDLSSLRQTSRVVNESVKQFLLFSPLGETYYENMSKALERKFRKVVEPLQIIEREDAVDSLCRPWKRMIVAFLLPFVVQSVSLCFIHVPDKKSVCKALLSTFQVTLAGLNETTWKVITNGTLFSPEEFQHLFAIHSFKTKEESLAGYDIYPIRNSADFSFEDVTKCPHLFIQGNSGSVSLAVLFPLFVGASALFVRGCFGLGDLIYDRYTYKGLDLHEEERRRLIGQSIQEALLEKGVRKNKVGEATLRALHDELYSDRYPSVFSTYFRFVSKTSQILAGTAVFSALLYALDQDKLSLFSLSTLNATAPFVDDPSTPLAMVDEEEKEGFLLPSFLLEQITSNIPSMEANEALFFLTAKVAGAVSCIFAFGPNIYNTAKSLYQTVSVRRV